MSTRANVIIKDAHTTLYFYRHSDGYPESTGEDLTEFVKMYTQRLLRLSAMQSLRLSAIQSAGWLIIRGHYEYNETPTLLPNNSNAFTGWKVGAYEPTDKLHGDVEYIYVIDLEAQDLTCRIPVSGFWDDPTLENTKPCMEFEPVDFKAVPHA